MEINNTSSDQLEVAELLEEQAKLEIKPIPREPIKVVGDPYAIFAKGPKDIP